MIILDTSVWIEHLRNNPRFFPKVGKILENREALALESVFGELLQGAKTRLIDAIILMHGIKSGSKIWTLDTKLLRVIPHELSYDG